MTKLRAAEIDASEDHSVNPRAGVHAPTMGDVIAARLSRRGVLKGALTASALAGAGPIAACATRPGETLPAARGPATFAETPRGLDGTHHIPEGYEADVLIRWGDALFADSPSFDPRAQSAGAQARQFGYNNDFIGFAPMPVRGDETARGLLCVNHEYVSTPLMLPGVAARYPESMTEELCAVEMAAHGGTVVEVAKRNGQWAVEVGAPLNRRITAETPMELSGPAAGAESLKTAADPGGRTVLGTVNNCAGGMTPWGTYLLAEENFNGYFRGAPLSAGDVQAASFERYGIPGGWYQWGRHFERFDIQRTPNEPNRFGWVVEVDIKDPTSMPKKRTAMGRFKHEGAETVIAPDGRVVVYMGDDQRFDYVYKFITADRFRANDPSSNADLLDEGVLFVARFDADGTVAWLPLLHGAGPLTAENGFASQADVLIHTRLAADLLGATPMDRPEDVEADPRTGRVYVMLTNNTRRTEDQVDAANPRAENAFGHIIEIVEPDGDFTARRSRWEILVRCGDPDQPEFGAVWNPATSRDGWFAAPDNCAIDPFGRLWIATDGNERTGAADGLWALETEGEGRGTGRCFFQCPIGAELCGPRFTPDGTTLFVAVQHPGDGDGATFEAPTTRWPDFGAADPPRPAVVAIRREDGGVVGG